METGWQVATTTELVYLHVRIAPQREGYLIGWQYFLKNHTDQCINSSYASVYRGGSDARYAHVASTRLQPTNLTRDGINFQFVQTKLIPVQVGDVVGIYTYGCVGGRWNIVSAQVGGGKAHKSGVLVGTGYTFTGFDDDLLLSLKAYTAGEELLLMINSILYYPCYCFHDTL